MAGLLRPLGLTICLAFAAAACSGGGGLNEAAEPTASEVAPTVDDVETVPSTPTPEPPPANAIKVGVLLDVGNLDVENRDPGNVMSPLDRQPGISFEVAMQAINDSGGLLGRPVSIMAVDTTSRLSVIASAAEDMVEAGVDLIVVTCEFDFAQPAIEVAEAAGVLVISPCASESGWATGDAGSLAFSMVATPGTHGAAMADYAWDEGYRNVALLTDSTAPEAGQECDAFNARWLELGGSFAFRESFSLRGAESLDELPTVGALRDAEAAVLCAFPTIGLELIAGVRLLGMEAPILASPSLDSGTWLPIDIAQATDGDVDLGDFRMFTLSSVWGDDPSPAMPAAIDGFFAAQATTPSSGRFVLGADLADIWALAVEQAGTPEGSAVAQEIRAMRNVETVSGSLSFAGSQAPTARELRVMRHQNGVLIFEQLVTAERLSLG